MSISSAEAHVNDDVTLTRRAFLACIADTDMFNLISTSSLTPSQKRKGRYNASIP